MSMQKYLCILILKELHYRLIWITETYLKPLIAHNAKFIVGAKVHRENNKVPQRNISTKSRTIIKESLQTPHMKETVNTTSQRRL